MLFKTRTIKDLFGGSLSDVHLWWQEISELRAVSSITFWSDTTTGWQIVQRSSWISQHGSMRDCSGLVTVVFSMWGLAYGWLIDGKVLLIYDNSQCLKFLAELSSVPNLENSAYFVLIFDKPNISLTLKLPGKLQLYGLKVYYVVHICDFGMLRVKSKRRYEEFEC